MGRSQKLKSSITPGENKLLWPLIIVTFCEAKKGVTISGNVTIWVIEGFRIDGIDSSIRIGLFV